MTTKETVDVNLPTFITEYQVKEYGMDDFEVRNAQSYANRALDALKRGELDVARSHVDMVLQYTRDTAIVWLLKAAVAQTADEQLDCMKKALAVEPHNAEALRIRGELDGTIAQMTATPQAQSEGDELLAQKVTCPRCNGVLELKEHTSEVVCYHCGYVIANLDENKEDVNKRALLFGMMRREANPTEWNIGDRWLRCTACNAITTFNRPALSEACRFCGSLAIVKETTNNRFEQPDLMVPFKVEIDKARQLVARVAEKGDEDGGFVKKLFGGQPTRELDHIDVDGAYLPFWVMDADMMARPPSLTTPGSYEQYGESLHLDNVLFFASRRLPQALFQRIEPFNLHNGVPYDPHLLVEYPAELYDIDLDRAAIEVRDRLQAEARKNPDVSSNHLIQTQGISYKLALLPIYLGRIVYKNGDVRRGVINGQTGRVVFER